MPPGIPAAQNLSSCSIPQKTQTEASNLSNVVVPAVGIMPFGDLLLCQPGQFQPPSRKRWNPKASLDCLAWWTSHGKTAANTRETRKRIKLLIPFMTLPLLTARCWLYLFHCNWNSIFSLVLQKHLLLTDFEVKDSSCVWIRLLRQSTLEFVKVDLVYWAI